MAEPARHLHAIKAGVDEAGEIVSQCPGCLEREDEIAGLQSTIRSLSAKLRYAKQDSDAKARKDEAWPKAVELFGYWMKKTGRPKRGKPPRFTPDRFRLVAPFLQAEGLYDCKCAIDGLVGSAWFKERGMDEFERPFQSSKTKTAQANFEFFREQGADRLTAFLSAELPLGDKTLAGMSAVSLDA